MQILIAGGTGFIGQALTQALLPQHKLFMIGRSVAKITQLFGDRVQAMDWDSLDKLDPNHFQAVINLAGQNIGAIRWTNAIKQTIKQSRVIATTRLVNWCAKATTQIPHLYNASAIGIYGLQPTSATLPPALTEAHPIHEQPPKDFLSEVGQAWEQAAQSPRVPITLMRFAVVLGKTGGILKALLPSFKLGLGSVIGTGQQAFSWIALDDLIAAIQFLLAQPELVGAINLCAPTCVTQQTFADTLARVIHRPRFLKMPAIALSAIFGQMAQELLLSGQSVYPARLLEAGFNFAKPDLAMALS